MVRMFCEVGVHRCDGVNETSLTEVPLSGFVVDAAALRTAASLFFPQESIPELLLLSSQELLTVGRDRINTEGRNRHGEG
jgi:hypothetical protein